MSPNDAYRPVGPAHRQATEAPVFPDRGFSASTTPDGLADGTAGARRNRRGIAGGRARDV